MSVVTVIFSLNGLHRHISSRPNCSIVIIREKIMEKAALYMKCSILA